MRKKEKEELIEIASKKIFKIITNKDISIAEAVCLLDSIKVYLYFENDMITGFIDGKKVDFKV